MSPRRAMPLAADRDREIRTAAADTAEELRTLHADLIRGSVDGTVDL